jgi:hypothetical protein
VKRYLLALLIGALLAVAAWSQDATDGEDATPAADAPAAETPAAAEDADDSDLDEQVYKDSDDDFRPSEEIPADQSIAFPTDI